LAELVQHRVWDAGDLPVAVAGGPPTDAEPAGQFPAELGGGDRRRGRDAAVQPAGVQSAVLAVLVDHGVGDDIVVVHERVQERVARKDQVGHIAGR
jgi:hypothetical protein